MAASKSSLKNSTLKDSKIVVIPERKWIYVHEEVREMAAELKTEMAFSKYVIFMYIIYIIFYLYQ